MRQRPTRRSGPRRWPHWLWAVALTGLSAGCTLGLEFEVAEEDAPTRPDVDTSLPPDAATALDTTPWPQEDDDDAVSRPDQQGPGCGDGVVDPHAGEACDPGPHGSPGCSADCQVLPGWVCGGGAAHSRCDQPTDRLVLDDDLDLSLEARPGRAQPDAAAAMVGEIRGVELLTAYPLRGVLPGDEVFVYVPVDANDPGRHAFAFVEAISGNHLELDREIGTIEGETVIVQRVPHYRSVDVGGHTLTTAATVSNHGRSLTDEPALGSGLLVMRVSETIHIGDGGTIDVSGKGLGGAVAPRPIHGTGVDGESGALSWGARGGYGAGLFDENRGGSGAPGCGCSPTTQSVDNGLGAGGGGGAPCVSSPECCQGCSTEAVGLSGAGGGLPTQFATPADANATNDQLTRVTPGAGAVGGGGGGAAAAPLHATYDGVPATEICAAPGGGFASGSAGIASECFALQSPEQGLHGNAGGGGGRGGGAIWLFADAIVVENGGLLLANGEAGGDGGDGGSAPEGGAGGGGGAGGQGGSGGTIILDAAELTLPTEAPAIQAAGGMGGRGGRGGGVGEEAGGRGGLGGIYLRGALAGEPGEPGLAPGTGGGGRGGRAGFEGRVVLRFDTLNGFSSGVGPEVDTLTEPRPVIVERSADVAD